MDKPRKSPNEPKKTKINPVTLCAHDGYKASFEACFMDLEDAFNFFQQHRPRAAPLGGVLIYLLKPLRAVNNYNINHSIDRDL